MKIKMLVLGCLTGVVVLFLGYGYSSAQVEAGTASSSRIGVVSIRKIFLNCRTNARYRADALAEQSKIDAEMEGLRKEIGAQEAGLRALIPGTADHLAQYKELLAKQASLEVQQKFNSQQRVLKDRRWTEELYGEILQITKQLAQEKGLDMVFERTEPEFPMPSAEEFLTTLNTHKVLYSGGCVDITDDVTARLDAKELKFKN